MKDMYPFSKNKSSFRIADILHQQQQQQQNDSQLLAHHLMMKGSSVGNEMSKNSDLKSYSNEIKNVNDLSSSKSPSPVPEAMPDEALKGDLPMKPTPMYSNFPLPFPLGIHPAFHPAAYLNYADAIHKGENNFFFGVQKGMEMNIESFFFMHFSHAHIHLISIEIFLSLSFLLL